MGSQGRLAVHHVNLNNGRHLTKDLCESNHIIEQFADERESVIHDVDAQPIAHDVRENEKRALYRTVGSVQKQEFMKHPRNEQILLTQHQKLVFSTFSWNSADST